ncbi:MAG TPA: beta-ketoacyl-[acyl-carrier-protein] synthase family protein [Thermoanaerobaculia bacterium]|nr:beta-ketoacyl-[acyl-carrier-protein] synthase family protein [Thermoanaerobaculia bacterium]
MRRVAVTGIGIVSCFGRGKAAALDAMRGGRSGIRRIAGIDATPLSCRIAGEVPAEAMDGGPRGADRFTRLAVAAAAEAAEEGGFDSIALSGDRVGVLIGTGLGGCETLDDCYRRIYREGAARVPPASIPSIMYNAAASAISTAWKARGVSYAVVSACASSAHAIGLAWQTIASGQAEAMFAGGADAPLTLGVIRGWESMRILSIDNEHPERACRPFSADRAGLVLAEGAAVLMLEELGHAARRGQPILGEIAGFGATSDAGHVTDPSAEGAARAMRIALGDLDPARIGYINAHGTGTAANDVTETRAIKEVFGARAGEIAVSSTKSMHGHAMGASGAIEIACSLLSLNEGFIPPTINLERADPACDLDYVPLTARQGEIGTFLSNSFGFGGMNAVVLLHTAVAVNLLLPSR